MVFNEITRKRPEKFRLHLFGGCNRTLQLKIGEDPFRGTSGDKGFVCVSLSSLLLKRLLEALKGLAVATSFYEGMMYLPSHLWQEGCQLSLSKVLDKHAFCLVANSLRRGPAPGHVYEFPGARTSKFPVKAITVWHGWVPPPTLMRISA